MKNYFLGIFPDEKTNYEIRKTVGDVGSVFEGLGIKARWSKPENYHVSLIYLGNTLNILTKYLIYLKLRKQSFIPFQLTFDGCSVGISRKYRGLVYLTFSDGGDSLRNLVFKLRDALRIDDTGQFIPHIAIGRINNDISDQEYKNIIGDVRRVNKKLSIKGLKLVPDKISLIESDTVTYKVLRNFPIK